MIDVLWVPYMERISIIYVLCVCNNLYADRSKYRFRSNDPVETFVIDTGVNQPKKFWEISRFPDFPTNFRLLLVSDIYSLFWCSEHSEVFLYSIIYFPTFQYVFSKCLYVFQSWWLVFIILKRIWCNYLCWNMYQWT